MACTDLEGVRSIEYKRSEFLLPSCGYVLKPQQDTVIVLECAKVSHGTIANIGFNQYGMALTMKKKVLTRGNKLMNKYGLDFTI
jgi:hypothetical protein